MYWFIKSATGWQARASSKQEAQLIAEKHAQEWADYGRKVKVEYWYNGIGPKPEVYTV